MARARSGFSLLGILIAMACIVVLMVVLSQGLKGAMGTGPSAPAANSATAHADREYLRGLGQACVMFGTITGGGDFPVPSDIADGERSLDTTANLYSALIAEGLVRPAQLISHNEENPNVVLDADYNAGAFVPGRGVPWDPSFKADLATESNVSFAHLPLIGDRFRRGWSPGSSTPIFGNRGPENGVPNPNSYTCDPTTGAWAGNVVFGDGHVEFLGATTLPGGDNLFAIEDGPLGDDAILAFTRAISEDDVTLQFD